MELGKSEFEITGNGLKFIAVITMLIDHMAIALFYWWDYYNVLRAIGRMAFPIYCYLLVEGFLHTKNVKKYALRLLGIAVISEIPFDYVVAAMPYYPEHNNVLWELLLGLIVLYCFKRVDEQNLSPNVKYLCRILVMFAGMALAYFTRLDYSAAGICCISAMYYLNGNDRRGRLLSFGMGVMILYLMSSTLEAWAFFMLIPMYFYKGKRGTNNICLRVFFYFFYPVHLLILGILAYL